MSRGLDWNEETIARLIREGYGRGTGMSYVPWLNVRSFSSRGITSRLTGVTVPRMYTVFSNEERTLFVLLDHAGHLDICEQFPLPRELTLRIAREAGIPHPRYPGTTCDMVMTCDFYVVTANTPTRVVYGISSKPKFQLEDERTIAKEEILRRSCLALGIVPLTVAPAMLETERAQNLMWMYSGESHAGLDDAYREQFPEWVSAFRRELVRSSDRTLSAFCGAFEQRHGLEAGTGLDVAKHLLRTKVLLTDLAEPGIPRRPLAEFRLADQRPTLSVVGA